VSLDHLWAAWRAAYIESVTSGDEQVPAEGSVFAALLASGRPDRETTIVHRGPRCFAILNRYPYTNGHLLVLPNRCVPDVTDLDDDEHAELWSTVRDAVVAVRAAYSCGGVNIGVNLGRAAGAGIPRHVHVHAVPRWEGDTNFMTAVAEARVMPESLERSWEKLREAWPRAAAP
jgi:ATP adenylyltransferase